jgi:hypothetical protein
VTRGSGSITVEVSSCRVGCYSLVVPVGG